MPKGPWSAFKEWVQKQPVPFSGEESSLGWTWELPVEKAKTQNVLLKSVGDLSRRMDDVGHLGGNLGSGGLGLSGHQTVLGMKKHQEFQAKQKELDPDYTCEVPLALVTTHKSLGEHQFKIQGRVDGLIRRSDALVLQEIKATTNPIKLYKDIQEDPFHPSVLQMLLYGYLLKKTEILLGRASKPLRLELVVLHLYDIEFSLKWEVDWPEEFLRDLELWIIFQLRASYQDSLESLQREANRRALGGKLVFPFAQHRPQQLKGCEKISGSLNAKKPIMVQAPTGTGKTVMSLFPALKFALEQNKQVFYLTPKNSQHGLAKEVVEKLRAQQQDVRYVIITGKEKVCFKEDILCHPDHCEYARHYYTKLKEHSVLSRLSKLGELDGDTIAQWAKRFEVCPFELSLDLTKEVDVVICDYNYLISPQSSLARYFENEIRTHEVVCIVDEAHNFYSRARDVYSPQLSSQALELLEKGFSQLGAIDHLKDQPEIQKKLKRFQKKLHKGVDSLFKAIELQMKRPNQASSPKSGGLQEIQCEVQVDAEELLKLQNVLFQFNSTLTSIYVALPLNHPLSRFQKSWFDFCSIFDLDPTPYRYLATWDPSVSSLSLKALCCDASSFIKDRLAQLAGMVFISATLKPFSFFQRFSGVDSGKVETLEVESSFDPSQEKILVVPQITSLFQKRALQIPKMAHFLFTYFSHYKNNTFVFFPSYALLRQVLEIWQTKYSIPEDLTLHVQASKQTNSQTQAILEGFKRSPAGQVLLAVQGGVFSEGIDLPGRALEACVVIGPGLPTFDLERSLIHSFFEREFGKEKAYQYTYVIPGMMKVIQSVGRVIRTPEDRGMILLCDHRFLHSTYCEVMPSHWLGEGCVPSSSKKLLDDCNAFWRS